MKKYEISQLFLSLLLLVGFVGFAFCIILLGARSYDKMNNDFKKDLVFNKSLAYLKNRISQVSYKDISVVDDNLILNFNEYYIIVYHDGEFLTEMITKELDNPLAGEQVCEIEEFAIEKINNFEYLITITNGGEERKMNVVAR